MTAEDRRGTGREPGGLETRNDPAPDARPLVNRKALPKQWTCPVRRASVTLQSIAEQYPQLRLGAALLSSVCLSPSDLAQTKENEICEAIRDGGQSTINQRRHKVRPKPIRKPTLRVARGLSGTARTAVNRTWSCNPMEGAELMPDPKPTSLRRPSCRTSPVKRPFS